MLGDQMTGNKPATNWSFVVNLANSIIGVAVLAFPLCFKQCGVILGLLLLSGCAWLAYTSCTLLAKAASVTKKRSYEYLAFHIFGTSGKLFVEVCSAGLLLGTLIAFFVIVGDICPEIVSEILDIKNSTQLRTTVLITLGILVILPLCMKSNLDSISNLSMMSLVFYSLFALRVIASSLHHISTAEFVTDVKYWDLSGVFRSLPIFAISYACQIQLFLVYHTTPDISIPQIRGLVCRAILLSSTIYFTVGYFGYISFYNEDVSGDIMMNYETTVITGLIKLGFVSSTILSFPLVVYPCRCSLYTLISSKSLHDNMAGTVHIPWNIFKYITCFIVVFTLTVGILVPKVEFVLGLMGSTLGSVVCFILPAMMFLKVVSKDSQLNMVIAKAVLFLGVLLLIVSTWATLSNIDMETHLVNLNHREIDPGDRFDGHDIGDVRHHVPVTAPPGVAVDLVVASVRQNPRETFNHPIEPKTGKVVHSNLNVDRAKQNTSKHKMTGKHTNESTKGEIKRDESNPPIKSGGKIPQEGDVVPGPQKNAIPPENMQPQKDTKVEKANMKKLLNLPKLEGEQNIETGTTSTPTTTTYRRDVVSLSGESTEALKLSTKIASKLMLNVLMSNLNETVNEAEQKLQANHIEVK